MINVCRDQFDIEYIMASNNAPGEAVYDDGTCAICGTTREQVSSAVRTRFLLPVLGGMVPDQTAMPHVQSKNNIFQTQY